MTITQKLTLKNLRLNKTRTIVTIIGIVLSVSLITVVAGIYTSFNESMIDMWIHNTGDYDVMLQGSQTESGMKKLEENPEIRSVYTTRTIGVTPLADGSLYTPYACVLALSPNIFESGFDFSLKEGAFPQKDDEIIVTEAFLMASGQKCRVGDRITLDLGVRTLNPDSTEEIGYYGSDSITDYEIPPSMYYMGENETFSKKTSKTYTVTGIVADVSGELADDPFSACHRIYTVGNIIDQPLFEIHTEPTTYIRFTDSAEKDCKHALGRVFGLTEEQADKLFSNGMLTEQEYTELFSLVAKSGINASNYLLNEMLLSAKGVNPDPESLLINMALLGFICLLIILASVFIIRNSFSISITEKTKLYGMLASTGATSRQIRRNVLFEGLVLGLISIPLGLLVGVGVTAGLIALVNGLMGEFIGKMRFVMMVPFWALLLAAGLGALTIFFSVYSSAVRASKISPIEAIRSNTDIRISDKKKPKSYKTPRYIEGIFGAGGIIAWKNMKRSRKQYRTTVISIVVSVAVYISVYSFVDYGFTMITSQFGNQEYNMSVSVPQYDSDSGELSLDARMKKIDKIRNLEGVEKSVVSVERDQFTFEIPVENMNPEVVGEDTTGGDYRDRWIKCIAVDDDKFNALASRFGISSEDTKDKAFIFNTERIEMGERNFKDAAFLVDYKGLTLTGNAEFWFYEDYSEYEYDEEGNPIENPEYPEPKEPEKCSVKLTIVDELPSDFSYVCVDYNRYEPYFVISMDTFREMLPKEADDSYYLTLSLYSEDCDTLEEELSDLAQNNEEYSGTYVMNYSKQMRQINSVMLLVQIFVYGFIIVIVLIGLTNIFNTITTNMKMRRKEFAMLQSIGMTRHEFNRMISLESLLYTTKSLLIGLPIGIGASLLIHFLFCKLSMMQLSYSFPWVAVLLSISVVMLLVWIIMRFSIKKVHKQNIIETIRNDNI